MASFQAKIGWKSPRKKENKNYRSDQFLPDPEQRIPKKQQKKKKKNHYGFFSSQNNLGKAEKIENKNYRSDQFLPDPLQKIPKDIAKNFKILKNTTIACFPAKTGWDRP